MTPKGRAPGEKLIKWANQTRTNGFPVSCASLCEWSRRWRARQYALPKTRQEAFLSYPPPFAIGKNTQQPAVIREFGPLNVWHQLCLALCACPISESSMSYAAEKTLDGTTWV
jgi:hypothetical protein